MTRWLSVALVLFPLLASADARLGSIDDNVLTSPKFNAMLTKPVRKPYFLGWDAEVTPAQGFFEGTAEDGGVAIDVPGKSVFVGTRQGFLVALGPGGETKWRVDVGGEVVAPPVVYGEYVIVGTSEGVLHILNKVTGERVARGILGEQLITRPVVAEFPGGVHRVFVGSGAESVFAVDLETGQKLWRAHRDSPSGFSVFGFATPVVIGGAVFMGYADGYVEARDPSTGSLKWERHVSPNGTMQDIDALGTNGVSLFAASYSGGIFSLDPSSGNVRWQKDLPRATHLAVDGANIYAAAPGLWAGLRTSDGAMGWRFTMPDETTTTDGIVGDRYLTFSVFGGALYFLDKLSGEPVGLFSTGFGFNSPPAVAGPAMCVLSNGGFVYSLTAP